MKHTYFFKDHCRIYWRVEFVLNAAQTEWEFRFLRSLQGFDDPEAHEVFHGSHNNSTGTPDVFEALLQLKQYYKQIFIQMHEHLLTLYDVAIEP